MGQVPGTQVLWNQSLDWQANQFLTRVSEHLLCSHVRVADVAIRANHQNRVRSNIEHAFRKSKPVWSPYNSLRALRFVSAWGLRLWHRQDDLACTILPSCIRYKRNLSVHNKLLSNLCPQFINS